ncbi:hypothetical protein MA16_Dca008075 [Dendrobium catenatum]|uniref:Uncharacterized protein n=1 Tax=Dendrobium catenatum TaxID=906689 RepID=A0A2I0WCW6_9ASPA|nr:hypothetical protein MA16_Dca008075 [Dendrobium catenatum]
MREVAVFDVGKCWMVRRSFPDGATVKGAGGNYWTSSCPLKTAVLKPIADENPRIVAGIFWQQSWRS